MGLELADSDEDAVWSEFSNSVILGDSRAVGFYFMNFCLKNRVMAEGGGIITDATKYLDQLKTLNPDMIFLCYGLNDVGLGQWPDADDYAKDYAKVVKKLQKALPDATIYINSILPAVGVGLDAESGLSEKLMSTMTHFRRCAKKRAGLILTIPNWRRNMKICIRKTDFMWKTNSISIGQPIC